LSMWERGSLELARKRSPIERLSRTNRTVLKTAVTGSYAEAIAKRCCKADRTFEGSQVERLPNSGNARGCNSFNANVGGGVTALDAQTAYRVSVLAVLPLENLRENF
jgi:hypothetical protein